MSLIFRFWRIFFGLVPPIGMMIRDYHLSLTAGKGFDWQHPKRRRRAKRLVKRFANLGPTFIKLAQVLAARADLFPGIYLEELRQLHDRVPPMANRRIMRQFRRATGHDACEVFDRFEKDSIASASLGQVHRAEYRGQTVAVKILKPDIRDLVEKDLRVLAWVFSVATLFWQSNPLRSLIVMYEEFSRTIHEEMDFSLEAEHIRYFKRLYADNDRVVIPAVVDDLSNRDVLVMEWIEGEKISNAKGVRAAGHDIPDLFDRLVTIFAEQIIRDGKFHADPHPGNILVDSDGRICLLDFGLVVSVPDEVRLCYLRAIVAAVSEDTQTLTRLAYELGAVRSDVNPIVLRQAMKALMNISLREDYEPVKLQRVAAEILHVFYEFPLHLPSELVYIAKTMSLIEGLGTLYEPRYNLLKDAHDTFSRIVQPDLERIQPSVTDRVVDEGKAVWELYDNTKAVMQTVARGEQSIRIYRGDIAEIQRTIGYAVRRLVFAMLMFGIWITGALVFVKTGNWWILGLCMLTGSGGLLLMFLMPNVPRLPRIVLPHRVNRE